MRLIQLISRGKENEVKQFECGVKRSNHQLLLHGNRKALWRPSRYYTTISVERNGPFSGKLTLYDCPD